MRPVKSSIGECEKQKTSNNVRSIIHCYTVNRTDYVLQFQAVYLFFTNK